MSCNQDLFKIEEDVIKKTWAKDIIDGKYSNIKYYSYSASENGTYSIDKVEHKICVDCDDDLFGTWDKTLKVLKIINQYKLKYDYIFRTNTSTYINVPLLDAFVQSLDKDDDKVYCAMIDAPKFITSPFEYCCYAQGNAILLKKKYVDIITDDKNYINFIKNDKITRDKKWDKYIFMVDDNVIGGILNRYFIDNGINVYNMYRDFRFNYKAICPNDMLHKYIAISLKSMQPRNPCEIMNYIHLHKLISSYYKEHDIDRSIIDDALKNPYIIKIKDGFGFDGIYKINDFIEMLKNNNFNIPYLEKVQI